MTATKLTKLREPFPTELVKQRKGPGNKMLDYVAIETVLERLLELVPDYSLHSGFSNWNPDTNTATAAISLSVGEKTGFGVGAMENSDADMALKSALSEAIKNAAKNGFGIALELWNEEHRNAIAEERKAQTLTLAQLKQIAKDEFASELKGMEAATQICTHLGLEYTDLQNRDVLYDSLKENNLV